jgi:hypothetical protein
VAHLGRVREIAERSAAAPRLAGCIAHAALFVACRRMASRAVGNVAKLLHVNVDQIARFLML